MKVSYNWLQDSFESKLPSPEALKEQIIMHSFEVETLEEIDALGTKDYLFDIKILPNRAHDCNGHMGIARELAVLLDLPLKPKVFAEFPIAHNLPALNVVVENSEICPRYSARIIRNIKVGESPSWLKERLAAIGQRSINNIVDIANYVMFQTSQPLHIFDVDKFSGDTINVRQAVDGEEMITLDGKKVQLNSSMLVIADSNDPLALAGIKGGMKAATSETTTNIILEAANFSAAPIRKTSQKTGIRTDASFRFEHELAPELAADGMYELTRLIVELASTDNTEIGEIVDVFPLPRGTQYISFTDNDVAKILGISMDQKTIESLLNRFKKHANFDWEKDDEKYTVMVPNERLDLICLHGSYSGGIKEDMIEELGRTNGYEKIPFVPLQVVAPGPVDKLLYYTELIRDVLVGEGFSEVYNYSIVGAGDSMRSVELRNPLADDKRFLRTNLSGELGKKLEFNMHNKDLLNIEQVKIFEIGRVFPTNDVDGEQVHCVLAIGSLGKKYDINLEVQRIAVLLQNMIGITEIKAIENSAGSGIFEFNLSAVVEGLPVPVKYKSDLYMPPDAVYKPISPFPFVTRDIAVFVPEEISSDTVLGTIQKEATNLLVNYKLFDVFTKVFPDGAKKTSYAFRLVFQAKDRTLTGEEINLIMEKITQILDSKESWKVR